MLHIHFDKTHLRMLNYFQSLFLKHVLNSINFLTMRLGMFFETNHSIILNKMSDSKFNHCLIEYALVNEI